MNNDLSSNFTAEIHQNRKTEKLIGDFYSLVLKNIKVDLIVLWTYNTKSGELYLYAFITDHGTMLRSDRMMLSDKGVKEFNTITKNKFHIFSDSRKSPGVQDIMTQFPVPQPFTTITVHSKMEDDTYSMVSLCAAGAESYGKDELQYIDDDYDRIILHLRYIRAAAEMEMLKMHVSDERNVLLKRLGYIGNASLVGEESGLKKTMELVRRVAPLDTTVLITGETGVGKEVIANAIHRESSRSSKPLVSVNCGAIPESLLDSELFGHEKGAFTDARQSRQGYFEQANNGTIFLDEIGELSFSAQVRLLRLLQSRQYQRVGGSSTISLDVRVIAATNRDLKSMVAKNLFRSDLWFRINTFPIYVPPLRERKGDIPELAVYFSRVKGKEMALQWTGSFADGAMAQLQAYDWPGNVRELQSVIERNLIISQGRPMSFENLEPPHYSQGDDSPSPDNDSVNVDFETVIPLNNAIANHIKSALKAARGRVEGRGGAAELLDINPSTLRAKMKKFDITVQRVLN